MSIATEPEATLDDLHRIKSKAELIAGRLFPSYLQAAVSAGSPSGSLGALTITR